MSVFLNNFVRMYSIKLKICILYHMNNTIRNTIFKISADVPLRIFFPPFTMVSSRSRLENFPVYLESCVENISSILDELQEHMFTKKPFYSAEIVRYALLLRYTSIFHYYRYHYCIRSAVARQILSNVHTPWEMRAKLPMMCV